MKEKKYYIHVCHPHKKKFAKVIRSILLFCFNHSYRTSVHQSFLVSILKSISLVFMLLEYYERKLVRDFSKELNVQRHD